MAHFNMAAPMKQNFWILSRIILNWSSFSLPSSTKLSCVDCKVLLRYRTYCGNQGKPIPKIYTRTGDRGTSVTIAGDRRPKNDEVFEALGATDELSSAIGFAREFAKDAQLPVDEQLQEIQCLLQDAGSNIATPKSLASPNQKELTAFDSASIKTLETWIDEYTSQLPPLRNFILPSGGKASASLQVARSICRRAERRITPLVAKDEIDPNVGKYMNRLSDYLFTLARYVAQCQGQTETIYRKVRPRERKK